MSAGKPEVVVRNVVISEAQLNDLLIGGNHLASALHDFDCPQPNKIQSYDEALNIIGQPGADVWVAWRAIMDIAQAMERRHK